MSGLSTQGAELLAATKKTSPEDADLVERFCRSKNGWRRNAVTAKRQYRQLCTIFKKAAEETGESRADILRRHGDALETVLRADLPNHFTLLFSFTFFW